MASYYVEELPHVPGERHLGTCYNCHKPLGRTYFQVTKKGPLKIVRRYCEVCWGEGMVTTG